MNKTESRKAVKQQLEAMLESLVDILTLLRDNESTQLDEMRSLVFAKRRAVALTEQCQRIFQSLVVLKHCHAAEQKHHLPLETEGRIMASGRCPYLHSPPPSGHARNPPPPTKYNFL